MKIKEFELQHKREIQEIENKFIEEFSIKNSDWVRAKRLRFLKDDLMILEKNNDDLLKVGGKVIDIKWFLDFVKSYIKENNKKMKRIKFEINAYENEELNDKNGITDEMIQRAREADCSQFVNVVRKENGRSWACCPFHQEKKPSFVCYGEGKGFYCFGCNVGGDAIELVMKLYNYSFVESVKKLNQ